MPTHMKAQQVCSPHTHSLSKANDKKKKKAQKLKRMETKDKAPGAQ